MFAVVVVSLQVDNAARSLTKKRKQPMNIVTGEYRPVDNLATRRGIEHATDRLLKRNRFATGTLAIVPHGELGKLPCVC